MRTWLEEHGVVSPPATPREKLLAKMRDTYVAATKPVWKAWSDSYIHQWLVDHGVLQTKTQKQRDQLVALMERYYYDVNDKVWDSWDDSQMKAWLVEHGITKKDAKIQREKMEKLVS